MKSSTKSSKSLSPGSSSLLVARPIATNSRVRQDEKYRKDMYLAFVNNALQQKANVSSHRWRLSFLFISWIGQR
jgi:RNA polymerase I-specific transcription initiation factor RRN3